jgi:hypothetical protein
MSTSMSVSWSGRWMKMLSGEWLVPCRPTRCALAADLEGAAVLEGLLRRGPGRVVVAQQELARLLMPDACDASVEQRRRAGVVGVVV